MKKAILCMLLSNLCINAFANCNEQNLYNSNWEIKNETVRININKKDNSYFNYYNLMISEKETFIGFKLSNGQVMSYKNLNNENNSQWYGLFPIVIPYDFSKEDLNNIDQIFINQNKNVSIAMRGANISQTYKFPLASKYLVSTKLYEKNIDIKNLVKPFKELTDNNDIYGKNKIKIYVNLINTADASQCALFESPDIEYDFGRKPFLKYFK